MITVFSAYIVKVVKPCCILTKNLEIKLPFDTINFN